MNPETLKNFEANTPVQKELITRRPVSVYVFLIAVLVGTLTWAFVITRPVVVNTLDFPVKRNTGGVCAQVITPAKNDRTGEVKDFPTPCSVPRGWSVIQPEVSK